MTLLEFLDAHFLGICITMIVIVGLIVGSI